MNKIEELRHIRLEIERLKGQEKTLAEPIVYNMEIVRNLLDVYKCTVKRQNGDPNDTDNRKKFLYAILFIFSPSTLVGDQIRHQLRELVSDVIGCTNTGISRDYKTAQFFYDTYQEFRQSTDEIIKDMLYVMGKVNCS